MILLGAAAALVPAACSGTATGTTPSTATTSPPTTTTVARVTTTTATPPPTTTATTTTTTTTVVTTTTADPLARPDRLVSNFDRSSVDDFDTTGDDLYRVVMELVDLFNYLEGNPTGTGDEMAGLMYEPSIGSWAQLVSDFDELAQNPGWHYVDPGITTVAIAVDKVATDTAIVRWASERGDQYIVDGEGSQVKTYKGWDLDVLTYRLHKGEDGRWRMAKVIDRIFPVPDSVLEAMVPVEWTGRTQ